MNLKGQTVFLLIWTDFEGEYHATAEVFANRDDAINAMDQAVDDALETRDIEVLRRGDDFAEVTFVGGDYAVDRWHVEEAEIQ